MSCPDPEAYARPDGAQTRLGWTRIHRGDARGHAEIGDFLGERWTVQEVDLLVDLPGPAAVRAHPRRRLRPGRHSLELARRGCRCFGVDVSRVFVEAARRRAGTERLAAGVAVADARDPALRPLLDATVRLSERALGLAGSQCWRVRPVRRRAAGGTLRVLLGRRLRRADRPRVPLDRP